MAKLGFLKSLQKTVSVMGFAHLFFSLGEKEGEHRDNHNFHGKTIRALLPGRKTTLICSFPNAEPQRSNEKQILLKDVETHRGEFLQMHLPSATQHSSAADGFNCNLDFFLYI